MKYFLAILLFPLSCFGQLTNWGTTLPASALAAGAATNNIGYVPVNKAGDTMTGTLTVTGLTNSARTANTFVVAGADKSDVSTATSAMLAATLSDKTGTGVAVFGTSPTITNSLTLTNASATTTALTINHASGATSNMITGTVGGTNRFYVDGIGHIFVLDKGANGVNACAINIGTTGHAGIFSSDNEDLRMWASGSQMAMWNSAGLSLFTAYVIANCNQLTPVSGVLQVGASAASPVSQTFKAGDGSGTDKSGGSLTLEGGQSTGTGTAGSLDLATGLTGEASGSSANAYSIRAHYKPKYVALTHAAATTIETFSLAANKILGGTATITCYATNSTPHLQSLTSIVQFDAVAVGTTITSQIKQTDNTAAVDSGTLACTYTILDNGNNTFSIQANANSSLTTPTERAKVVVTALNGNSSPTITDP